MFFTSPPLASAVEFSGGAALHLRMKLGCAQWTGWPLPSVAFSFAVDFGPLFAFCLPPFTRCVLFTSLLPARGAKDTIVFAYLEDVAGDGVSDALYVTEGAVRAAQYATGSEWRPFTFVILFFFFFVLFFLLNATALCSRRWGSRTSNAAEAPHIVATHAEANHGFRTYGRDDFAFVGANETIDVPVLMESGEFRLF